MRVHVFLCVCMYQYIYIYIYIYEHNEHFMYSILISKEQIVEVDRALVASELGLTPKRRRRPLESSGGPAALRRCRAACRAWCLGPNMFCRFI